MEPTVRPRPRVVVLRDGARERLRLPGRLAGRDSLAVHVLAFALLVSAVGAGAVLVTRGEPWPPPGPVVGLAVLLAIAVNRGAFFPTELMATAEAAVLFTAVVGFHTDSVLLGPLVVALAVGPVDALHWRQLAFARMAYNSGSQGLAVLVGAVVFRAVSHELGPSLLALVVAAALAAVPYALIDSSCGVALMLVRGSSFRDASSHQWALNGLALPLACIGALAGYLALDVGWWLALLVLVPVPWVPEIVLVRAQRVQRASPRTQVRLLGGLTIVGAFVVAAGVAWSSGLPSLPVLVGLAVVLGAELRVSTARAVPPLAALVVVAAAAIVDGPEALVLAGLVGATVAATAWVQAHNARVASASRAIACAAAGGVACGVVVGAVSTGRYSLLVVLSLAAGAALFEAVAVVTGGSRRDAWVSMVWTAPVVLVAALLTPTWNVLGAPGSIVFAAGVGGALACVAWAGAPPWGSRFLGPMLGTRSQHRTRAALLMVVVAAVAVAGVATQVHTLRARGLCVLVAASLAETAVALALVVVRQWRFAPAPRVRSASALGVVAVLVVVAYIPPASSGHGWSVAILAGLLLVPTAIAWPLARLADSVGVSR